MDNTTIYEKFDWGKLQSSDLRDKIDLVMEYIPNEVKTILDVGCGNGVITNELAKHYQVTGVDRSLSALDYVETEKLQASSDKIPLRDNSFDMVFSSELLEHLEDDVLKKTIDELKRLSNNYIFITVPNAENPDKLAIRCPECRYEFNRPNHLRSFNAEDIKNQFSDYQIIRTGTHGKKVRYYNNTLLKIKKRISPSSAWIPYYWISREKRDTVCPKCEHSFSFAYQFNIFSALVDMLNLLVSRKKPYWLFVLMKRK